MTAIKIDVLCLMIFVLGGSVEDPCKLKMQNQPLNAANVNFSAEF